MVQNINDEAVDRPGAVTKGLHITWGEVKNSMQNVPDDAVLGIVMIGPDGSIVTHAAFYVDAVARNGSPGRGGDDTLIAFMFRPLSVTFDAEKEYPKPTKNDKTEAGVEFDAPAS